MSISLNNHESRIKALENGGAGSWSKGSNANGNWVKESKTGLLIQFGATNTGSTLTVKLPVVFTDTSYKVIATRNNINANESAVVVYGSTVNQFNMTFIYPQGSRPSSSANWLAIGYLISYRILKYAYACKSLLFTPLRKLEV